MGVIVKTSPTSKFSDGLQELCDEVLPYRAGRKYSSGPTARWWHAVDLISAGKWRELLATREFTERACIVNAVTFGCRYSRHDDKKAAGGAPAMGPFGPR